ncbi:MAG: tRNA (uridine(34)/cytosine(34)/5-carboxymethylaminomethyluridine(34)-2'-O)-methyltransferase TrmL [Clostridia bacterium]
MINVVLVEPEIPNNTGNIVRTCAATGAILHLIEPFGFSLEDKYLKRAGLDYWDLANIKIYKNLDEFFKVNKGQYFFASTKSQHNHTEVKYEKDCFVFFGKETKGLPEELLKDNYDKCVRIPMKTEARSLNLANSVALIVYEYLRQYNFEGLNQVGHLTKFDVNL